MQVENRLQDGSDRGVNHRPERNPGDHLPNHPGIIQKYLRQFAIKRIEILDSNRRSRLVSVSPRRVLTEIHAAVAMHPPLGAALRDRGRRTGRRGADGQGRELPSVPRRLGGPFAATDLRESIAKRRHRHAKPRGQSIHRLVHFHIHPLAIGRRYFRQDPQHPISGKARPLKA